MSIEEIAFQIIVHAGNARGFTFEAIQAAEEGNFEEADKLMSEADDAFVEAHRIQTDLIQAEARGEKADFGLLMVHAQDHLMTAQSEKNLAQYIINLHKKIANK